jgi:hypothetical protein
VDADAALASFSCVSLTVELVGSLVDSASDTLLKLKLAAIVVLGNEVNKDVVFAVFASCVGGVKEGNQEIGFSFAEVSLVVGTESEGVPVVLCVVGTELDRDGDVLKGCILVADDRPKNDLDVLASLPSDNTEDPAGVGCAIFSCVS